MAYFRMKGPLFTYTGQEWSSNMRSIKNDPIKYEISIKSIQRTEKSLSFLLFSSSSSSYSLNESYLLSLYRLESGPVRFLFGCKTPHFNPSSEDSIIKQTTLSSLQSITKIEETKESIKLTYIYEKEKNSEEVVKTANKERGNDIVINVIYSPFEIQIINFYNSEIFLSLNSNSFLCIEKNSVDFTFHGHETRLIGIPSRESETYLKPTLVNFLDSKKSIPGIVAQSDNYSKQIVKSDPYRVFNCDTGEYRPTKEFSVYGTINFIQSSKCAIYFSNSSDTFIDIIKNKVNANENICENIDNKNVNIIEINEGNNKIDNSNITHENKREPEFKTDSISVHLYSECGPIDLFVFTGDRISTTSQLTSMIGPSFFPSLSNFGFGHCKWGIKTQKEVEEIMNLYEKNGIPFDTFWLDIDHLIANQPFTVNSQNFPNFENLRQSLRNKGRNLAIIEDPHLPYHHPEHDHEISNEMIIHNYGVLNNKKELFVGHCWPGPSVYPDFLNIDVRKWWGEKVPIETSLWNDMNEPSVFNSTEVTMPRDNIHRVVINLSNENDSNFSKTKDIMYVEHRCVHNLYGHFHSLSSFDGILKKNPKQRPFILTRSFFGGTQRHAAVWTGDCPSSIKDLRMSIHQINTMNICGMNFVGADIGGFFGSPKKELIELWTLNAIWFYPFLRIHAHIESESRHQIVASSNIIKHALNERICFAPYWYTLFYRIHTEEYPIAVRFANMDFPQYYSHKNEIMLIGDALMAMPIFDPSYFFNHNQSKSEISLPKIDDKKWICLRDFKNNKNEQISCEKTIINSDFVLPEGIPLLMKRGTIVPIFNIPSESMIKTLQSSDIGLLIAVDENGCSEGVLFLDDGISTNYEHNNDFIYRQFRYEKGSLSNNNKKSDSINFIKENKNTLFCQKKIGTIFIFDGKVVKKFEKLDFEITENWLHNF